MNILVGFNSTSEDFEKKIATQLGKSGIAVDSVIVRSLKSSVMEYAKDQKDHFSQKIFPKFSFYVKIIHI